MKKSTTEFTSSQNHSLSLAAINWGERNGEKYERHDAGILSICFCQRLCFGFSPGPGGRCSVLLIAIPITGYFCLRIRLYSVF